jgi:hypothetical protein
MARKRHRAVQRAKNLDTAARDFERRDISSIDTRPAG